MITDKFSATTDSIIAPATNCFPITPSDVDDLSVATKAIYIGEAGDLAVRSLGGDLVTFANVQAGTILDVRIRQVRQTGTTAGSLVGLS